MELKANELRIGNYVIDIEDGNLYQIPTWLSINNSHFMSPIPLTEEWLIKFGFNPTKESDIANCVTFNNFDIAIHEKSGSVYIVYNHIVLKHIQYVHQLQNLYFALTGKELAYHVV